MPLVGSVGISKDTPFKLYDFHTIVDIHMNCVQAVLGKHDWAFPAYCYLDLNAGPGTYAALDGRLVTGSPLIALELAMEKGLPLIGTFCERAKQESKDLALSLVTQTNLRRSRYNPWFFSGNNAQHRVRVYAQDYRHAWIKIQADFSALRHRYLYGLLYSDESGNVPPFELFATFAHTFKYIALLIHISATSVKRVFYAGQTTLQQRLDALLTNIPKEHWLIREPIGKHQWTFLLGTNWKGMPEFRKGFYPIRTPKGKNILHFLSVNAQEYVPQEMPYEQLSLFTPGPPRARQRRTAP